MIDQIKVAIIGAGIGNEHLEAYLRLTERFQIAYLCDIDTERADQVLRDKGADPSQVKVESSFDAIIADETVDLVDICLPPHLHFQMSKAALEAGKHVVCEKPLVNSLRAADELADVVRKSGCALFPVFQYRYGAGFAKLKALMDAGLAGKPLVASVETHWDRDAEYYANPWRGTWKGEQGGAVLGHAIHNHDLLCAVFGPIAQLHAFSATRVNDIEVEDCASIAMQMENGALATSSVTLGSYDNITRFRFCFEHLTAESGLLPYNPSEGDWSFNARGNAPQKEVEALLNALPEPKSGFTGFFEAIADHLQRGKNNAVMMEDGRRSIELVTAIYESSRSGKPVALPIDNSASLYDGWLPSE